MIARSYTKLDLFELARGCARIAEAAAEVIAGPMTLEANQRLDEGFLVTAPEVLAHARNVFERVATRPGSTAALREIDSDAQRVDLICALALAVAGFENEVDIRWSSAWASFREGQAATTISRALDVLAAWNTGKRDALLQQMHDDVSTNKTREINER